MAPILLLFCGHNPRLGRTVLVWGAQAVIWGVHPRNAPSPWRRACTEPEKREIRSSWTILVNKALDIKQK